MKSYIILGTSFPALFFARLIGKKKRTLYCIAPSESEILMYSKYGMKYTSSTIEDLQAICYEIISKTEEKPVALICSGFYLDLILESFPGFFELVKVFGSNVETLQILSSKINASKKLEEKGLNLPDTYLLEDVEKTELNYPIILKWDTKLLYDDKVGKTKIIKNEQEYISFVNSINLDKLKKHIIIQNYISGEGIVELGYGAYYESGVEVAGIVFEQKRQYPKGIASFAIEKDGEVGELISKALGYFLLDINYSGFIQFDLLWNSLTGDFFILDINPRPWGCIKIIGKKYPDIVDYILGDTDKVTINHTEKPIGFIRLFHDLSATLIECRRVRKISPLFDTFKDYLSSNFIVDEFDRKDLKPIYGGLVKGFSSVFKSGQE